MPMYFLFHQNQTVIFIELDWGQAALPSMIYEECSKCGQYFNNQASLDAHAMDCVGLNPYLASSPNDRRLQELASKVFNDLDQRHKDS
eukprot:g63080.t1